jgi:predicted NUDIX family phosphoesterase
LEFVWVVPRSALFPTFTPHGLLALDPAVLEERFLRPAREQGFFVERRWAETHPEVKQPIPYVVVQREEQVLCLTRLSTQGEKRLHGKRSIGVGGHINPCDAPPAQTDGATENNSDIFARACQRELHEELVLPESGLALRPIGLLNDETTPVGAVHVGLVYALDARGHEVGIREHSAMAGGFEPLAALRRLAEAPDSPFETWSSLLLRSGALHAAAGIPHLQR